MESLNEIVMHLAHGRINRTGNLFQYDYGQKLVFLGVTLPLAYEVHFSNDEHGQSKTMIGDQTGVDIPDEFLLSGADIHVWVYLHESQDDGETVYHGIIGVIKRAKPTNQEPTPVQQSEIDQAIAALNAGVTEVEGIAEAMPGEIQEALAEAKASGEFDGFSPTATVSKSGDTATISITDKEGTTTAQVKDGEKGDPGTPGQDGISPIATVTKSDDTATISITDKNGTTTATVKDGKDGTPGQDGVSPTATVTKTGDTATISITDKNGTTTAQISDGQDGDTGATPVISIGTVSTLTPGSDATASMDTTDPAHPVLSLGIPEGEPGNATIDDTSTANNKVWSAKKVNDLKSALGLGDYGKFYTTAGSNGWYNANFSVKANTKYKFTNIGSVVITPNIYGQTGSDVTPLYTGTGTSNILVGGSVEFTATQNDEKIRLYYTTGNNGFEIREITEEGIYKDIEDIQTDIEDIQTDVSNLNEKQEKIDNQIDELNQNTVQTIYNPDNTTLANGRILAFTGVVDTDSQFKYIELAVSEGDQITFTPDVTGSSSQYGYAFYDANKDYTGVGGNPTADIPCTVVIPSGVSYFRYGQLNSVWDNPIYRNFYVITAKTKKTLVDLVKYDVVYKDLTGKTWNAVGDSITYQGKYISRVANITGLTAVNCGVGASTIAINDSYMTAQSIVERVLGLNGNTPYDDADVWTLMGGLNDCLYSSPIGTLAPVGSTFDKSTVYGALQAICEYILNLRAHPRLVLMTPTQSLRDTWDTTTYPTTMALIRQAIIDVGAVYSVPVVDVWAEGGISLYNIQKATNPTTSDGVHINELGADILSPFIAHGIKDLFYGV